MNGDPQPKDSPASPARPGSTIALPPLGEQPGQRIGRYKLLQQIGEGGCGVVFMAEQTEPVRRKVALKVIKLGMDTKQVVARFEAERQALALMDHPNIAKVLDGGATDTGRPFFVMELVAGIKLTEYCDKHKLATHERLDLFIQVCHAIQHAHQKGIIHRDIKPSNVLVTLDTTHQPLPKVIDFGIAKATTGQALTDKTLFTAYEQFIGTPAYMSPEQADLTGLDIDTRTDIYSLGVLLYELLTGKTPFDTDELMRGGVETLRQTLRDKEATTPSMRLKHLTPTDLTQVAERHHVKAPELIHTVRGDLDWIVLKCLEKDRTRRYETANGIAMDLLRYLNNEPIVARPPSTLYRFGKMVRRNKVAFTAVNAVALSIAIGFGVSTRLYLREKAARAEVLAQKQTAEEQRALAVSAKQDAETQRDSALRAEQQAETASRTTRETLKALRLQSAREAFASDNAALGLAYLALVLRQEPTNSFVGPWIVSALSQQNFALPSASWSLPDRTSYAEYSPDGRRIVFASLDRFAQVIDASNGKPVTPRLEHAALVQQARFSPDGLRVVSASEDRTARIWDAITGQPIGRPLQHEGKVSTARFSPDGTRVVTASWDATARVWDTQTGEPVTPPLRHKRELFGAQFSPDGRRVATASQDGTFALWDAATGEAVATFRPDRSAVRWIEFSPDGASLAVGFNQGTAEVWNVATRQRSAELVGHETFVSFAGFGPGGQTIATASDDRSARVWDALTGLPITPPLRHQAVIKSVSFSPDGQRIVTAGYGIWQVWDSMTGKPLGGPPNRRGSSSIGQAQFNPDGTRVLAAGSSWRSGVWDIKDGRETPLVFRHLNDSRRVPTAGVLLAPAKFSPDGRLVATAGATKPRVWDATTGKILQRGASGNIRVVEFSPDGKLLATIEGGIVRIWNTATGETVGRPMQHPDRQINTVRFSPDGRFLVTSSDDQTARVWEASTGAAVSEPLRLGTVAKSAEFSPDGRLVLVACGWSVRVFDVRSGEAIIQVNTGVGNLNVRARFSNDGRRFLTVDTTQRAVIWDTSTGKSLMSLRHDAGVRFAEISRDDKYVLTASDDRSAKVWDAETGRPVGLPMTHFDIVEQAAFSPDGLRVATASWDKTARVWDARTGQPLTEPLRHDGPVYGVHWSPDGRRLLTSSTDGTARLWEVPPITAPAPKWLPQLAQTMAGGWFSGEGVFSNSYSMTNLFAIKRELQASTADDDYTRWGKWFFADRATRTISAWSPVTVPEYAKLRVDENTLESLREAVLLAPTNAVAVARYARKLADQDPAQHPRAKGEADFLSRRALTLAPNDANVQRLRAEVEQKIGTVAKPQ